MDPLELVTLYPFGNIVLIQSRPDNRGSTTGDHGALALGSLHHVVKDVAGNRFHRMQRLVERTNARAVLINARWIFQQHLRPNAVCITKTISWK